MKEVISKLRIVYAKPIKVRKNWNGQILAREGKILIEETIESYAKVLSAANIYLIIYDRLFYSPTLSAFHRLSPKKVTDSLIKYILEGITVSETAIESIELKMPMGTYFVSDIFEIIGSEEITKNFKNL